MIDDRWLSVEEIAAYLGVKRDTIYKWIDRKGMPGHKVGRLWKFRRQAVDEWVTSGCAEPADEAWHDTHADQTAAPDWRAKQVGK